MFIILILCTFIYILGVLCHYNVNNIHDLAKYLLISPPSPSFVYPPLFEPFLFLFWPNIIFQRHFVKETAIKGKILTTKKILDGLKDPIPRDSENEDENNVTSYEIVLMGPVNPQDSDRDSDNSDIA